MPDITNIVNTIIENGSTELQARIPQATIDNIDAVGNAILTYQNAANEFLSALVNKIAFTLVRSKTWDNPLAILKQGVKPLGYDIENTHINPATDQGYDPTGVGLLLTSRPDVKTEYFRLNRQGKYKVTIWEDQLKHAFTSWDNVGKMLEGIVNSLYSGDYIDEFILMKNVIAEAVIKQRIITASHTAITDVATATAFLTALKQASSGMTYPSPSFNAYAKVTGVPAAPVITWTPKEQQILITRSDILNTLDTTVLASVFNLGKAEYQGRIIEVDNFGFGENVTAVLMDQAALQVWDEMSKMSEFFNADGLYRSYFWHHWQTYALSLMANCIAFVDDAVAPAAPAITAPGATDTTVSGTGVAGCIVFVTINDETRWAVVESDGSWTVGDFTPMVQADSVVAYQVDGAGNKSLTDTEAVTA